MTSDLDTAHKHDWKINGITLDFGRHGITPYVCTICGKTTHTDHETGQLLDPDNQ